MHKHDKLYRACNPEPFRPWGLIIVAVAIAGVLLYVVVTV